MGNCPTLIRGYERPAVLISAVALTMSKNLVDLDIDEVVSWLKSISLDNAFGGNFKEQQIDGSMLQDCEEDDFEPSDFPKARKMHWKKFW